MERIVYENPPVQEAMIEIGIVPSKWDPIALGRYFESVKPLLDGDPVVENLVASVQTAPGESTSVPVSRVRFQSADGQRAVQLQHASVSAHVIAKYHGWDEDFRPFATEMFAKYAKESPDDRLARVAVRFINLFRLPMGEGIDFSGHFTGLPPVPTSVGLGILNVIQQSKLVHAEERAEVDIAFGINVAPDQENVVNVILDIGVGHFFESPDVSFDEALKKADRLHVVVRSCFESYITEEMRNRLGRKHGEQDV